MFQINDTVMYGNSEVCKIVDIRPEKFDREEMPYYILKPVYDEKLTIYCPTNNEKVKIRRLLSIEEVHDLIKIMPDSEVGWIDNDQQRREKFSEVLKSGNYQELIKLIKSLHFKREEKIKSGKKFHIADERIMKEAESIMYAEFAHVLNIKPDEVVPFIMGEIDKFNS